MIRHVEVQEYCLREIPGLRVVDTDGVAAPTVLAVDYEGRDLFAVAESYGALHGLPVWCTVRRQVVRP